MGPHEAAQGFSLKFCVFQLENFHKGSGVGRFRITESCGGFQPEWERGFGVEGKLAQGQVGGFSQMRSALPDCFSLQLRIFGGNPFGQFPVIDCGVVVGK